MRRLERQGNTTQQAKQYNTTQHNFTVHVGHTQECHGVMLRNVDFCYMQLIRLGCVHTNESGMEDLINNYVANVHVHVHTLMYVAIYKYIHSLATKPVKSAPGQAIEIHAGGQCSVGGKWAHQSVLTA